MARNDEFDVVGEFVKMDELMGEVLLITATEYVDVVRDENGDIISGGIVTQFGRKDFVLADIVVISQDGQPTYTDQTILQNSLISKLKRKAATGRPILGVLAKGEAKRGQAAPYILEAPSEDQKQMARDYLAGRTVAAAVAPEPEDPFAVKA